MWKKQTLTPSHRTDSHMKQVDYTVVYSQQVSALKMELASGRPTVSFGAQVRLISQSIDYFIIPRLAYTQFTQFYYIQLLHMA